MKMPPEEFVASRTVRVTLGVAIGGYLHMWQDGAASLWKVTAHATYDEYQGLLGTGAFSTDAYEDGLYAEAASFDPVSSVLAVAKTLRFSHSSGATIGSCIWLKLKPSTREAARREQHWDDVEELIYRASEGAQARGEVLLVGRGPHPRPDGHGVVLGATTMNAWTSSVISASPPPAGDRWGSPDRDGTRTTLLATMSPTAREEAASLTVNALRGWGVAPFDVGIGFVVPIERLLHAG